MPMTRISPYPEYRYKVQLLNQSITAHRMPPTQPTITDIRVNNIISTLSPLVSVLEEISNAFGTPFMKAIVHTTQSLLTAIRANDATIRFNWPHVLPECQKEQSWMHPAGGKNTSVALFNYPYWIISTGFSFSGNIGSHWEIHGVLICFGSTWRTEYDFAGRCTKYIPMLRRNRIKAGSKPSSSRVRWAHSWRILISKSSEL